MKHLLTIKPQVWIIPVMVSVIFVLTTARVNAQTFSFGAAGDYANGSNFRATVDQVAAHNPNFHLILGDNSYSSGSEQGWCNTWKAKYNNVLLVAGNHDTGESSGGNIDNYIKYCPFTLSGLVGSYGKQYYFDYPATNPTTRVIMIAAGVKGSLSSMNTYTAGGAGYSFTEQAIDDARSKGIKWIVVGMHKNYISMLEKGNEMGNDLIPMLVNKRVDLILQGHEHGYERTKQLSCIRTGTPDANCFADSDNTLTKGKGTVIVVLGTGGQGLRGLNTGDSEAANFVIAENKTYGFGKFTISPSQINYTFVRSAGGNLSDSFTIENTTTSPTATLTPTKTPTPTPTKTPLPSPTPVPATATPTPTESCPAPPSDTGRVISSVTIGTTGIYKIWSRMMGANGTNDSYYLQVDNTCPILVGNSNVSSSEWQWINHQNGSLSSSISQTLTQGTHTITLIGNEEGVKVDKLIFMSDTSCTPTGLGGNCITTSTPTATPLPVVTASPTQTPTVTPTKTPAPTPTIHPQGVRFNVAALLQGIGKGGDNVTPGAAGNTTPKMTQRAITLTLYDKDSIEVASATGVLTYNPTVGNFTGTINTPTITQGTYTAYIKSDRYLRRRIPIILSISNGQTVTLPQITLVLGDTNNDNVLNIIDYSLIVGCYSDFEPAKNCIPGFEILTDLNDDGNVNAVDYNLFLRNTSVQTGD